MLYNRVEFHLSIFIFVSIQSDQALYHLQKHGVCHRDISLENVLVDENTKALVIDLGMCVRIPYNSPNGCDTAYDVSSGTLRRLLHPQGQVSCLRSTTRVSVSCFTVVHYPISNQTMLTSD